MSDLVTGEAVELELRLAKLASRSLAITIDLAVQLTALLVGVFVLTGALAFVDGALAAALGLLLYITIVLGYPVTFETLTRGRSLGKLALGLRVVRDDGGPIRFRHALVRGLLGVVEFWMSFGAIALIASLASTRGRRLGDHLAGTVVVHERVPVRASPVAMTPPGLESWAGALDLTRLPDDLALAARQFLARWNELAPTVRENMGSSLARAFAQVTTPPPPVGVPPWALLSAVLAERRRRELLRFGGPYPGPAAWGAPPAPPPQIALAPPAPPPPPAAPVERPGQGGFTPPS